MQEDAGRRVSAVAILLLLASLAFLNACPAWVGTPLRRAQDDAKPELLHRDQALATAYEALTVATADCPAFHESGYNMPTNWARLGKSSCDSSDLSLNFMYDECTDYQFVREKEFNACLISILLIKGACDSLAGRVDGRDRSLYDAHFLSYSVCAAAFKSESRAPLMFM